MAAEVELARCDSPRRSRPAARECASGERSTGGANRAPGVAGQMASARTGRRFGRKDFLLDDLLCDGEGGGRGRGGRVENVEQGAVPFHDEVVDERAVAREYLRTHAGLCADQQPGRIAGTRRCRARTNARFVTERHIPPAPVRQCFAKSRSVPG